jgi:streptomycin 6-kinase
MAWWNGGGAARVLAREGEALLLERATGGGTLADLVRGGSDDSATDIICRTAAALHAPRPAPPPETLKPLAIWFRALEPAARAHGGWLTPAATSARRLLSDPREVAVLHGDLHHDNVLDFGPKGWLAIDPKGLIGERGYDYANLFCNPWPEAAEPGRLRRRLARVAVVTGQDPDRIRLWILAYAGLSAAWTLSGGGDPSRALEIAAIVADD